MSAPKRYLWLVLWGILLLVGAAAALNTLVDPYAVLGSPRIAGFNALKPFAGDRGRTTKLHQVLRVKPKGLVVGNSRPEMGLAPDHPCWPAAARPVYNVALPGLGIYSQVRYAQHAQLYGPVHTLVMTLDFVDFLAEALPTDATRWPPEDERSGRFAVDPHGRPTGGFTWVRLADTVDAVLSLTTLAHSLMTVLRQDEPAPSRTAAGFHAAEATYQPIVRNEGARALFTQKNVELAERYGGVQWQIFSPGEAWSPRFEAVARLVRQSQAAGTEVVLAINPLHAEYLVLLDSIGLWPLMQEWKRTLARIGRNEDVPVWDFSLFDDHATENVDDLAPRGQALEWFWEPAHYRRELGDLMLANIFRRHCPPALAQAPQYGVRLDMLSESGFEAFGQAQRQAREAYKAAHPSVVARLERMLRP